MHTPYPPIAKSGTVSFRLDKPLPFICQPILILVVSMILYLSTMGNNFVYDDTFTVVNNYLIRSWHKIPMLFTHDYFTAAGELSYRPVVTVSYFIDYSLWRLNPIGFHLTNVLLHSLNAVLLFFLLTRLLGKPNRETGKGSQSVFPKHADVSVSGFATTTNSVAFIASLIFCTHPLLAETVNAISYREDLLSATFSLSAFLFYLKAYQRNTALWYAASLLCYAMGLFSKETAITFPMLIGLYDILNQNKTRLTYNLVRYYIGYILVSVLYLLVRFILLHNPAESYIPYPQHSLRVNILTMTKVLAAYLKLLLFPTHLNADYVVPHASSCMEISFLVSLLLIISLTVIICRMFFHSKMLFFSGLWFFITLLPVLNIIPIENIMAERYLYIPLVGFCIPGGFLLHRIPISNSKHRTVRVWGFGFLVTLILAGFSWQTCSISKIWFDELSFWSMTAKRSPQSSRAHNNVGVLYKKMGFVDAAIQEYQTAIQIKPDYSEAHGNLANVYVDKGFRVLDRQTLSKAHNNLAKADSDEGHFKNAIAEYEKSLEISPLNETAHFNLGVTYGKLGLSGKSEIEYENVIRINNNNPHAHNNLGNIYEDKGLLEKAMSEYERSLSIDPNSAITHNNLGNIHGKRDAFDEAVLEYRTAIKIEPSGSVYHENLGNTYMKKGLIEEAIAAFESIVRLHPEHSSAYVNLITLYWNYKKDREKAVYYLQELADREPDQKDDIQRMMEKLEVKK